MEFVVFFCIMYVVFGFISGLDSFLTYLLIFNGIAAVLVACGIGRKK